MESWTVARICCLTSATCAGRVRPCATTLLAHICTCIHVCSCRGQQLYYRNYTRQYFANWNTETDPAVLQQLHTKARQDASWVLQKVRRTMRQQ
jgi:hypothetical protein